MSLRHLKRQLVIELATRLGADDLNAALTRRLDASVGRQVVRVLFFHGTPANSSGEFRRQLAWLQERYDFIDFDGFKRRLAGQDRSRAGKPALLFTFDDGFVSNHDVAAPLLEEVGTRGLFFVVPAFSTATDEESRAFFRGRLHGRADRYERAMTPDEIRDLAARGHAIGNHTFSHARLSDTLETDHRHEILDAADVIESWTGRPVEAFAWPYVWNAMTPAAHQIASRRHRYCFAPCAGRVDAAAETAALLWRTNAEVDRSFREFRFQCSGLADYTCRRRRRQLRRALIPVGLMSPAPA